MLKARTTKRLFTSWAVAAVTDGRIIGLVDCSFVGSCVQ